MNIDDYANRFALMGVPYRITNRRRAIITLDNVLFFRKRGVIVKTFNEIIPHEYIKLLRQSGNFTPDHLQTTEMQGDNILVYSTHSATLLIYNYKTRYWARASWFARLQGEQKEKMAYTPPGQSGCVWFKTAYLDKVLSFYEETGLIINDPQTMTFGYSNPAKHEREYEVNVGYMTYHAPSVKPNSRYCYVFVVGQWLFNVHTGANPILWATSMKTGKQTRYVYFDSVYVRGDKVYVVCNDKDVTKHFEKVCMLEFGDREDVTCYAFMQLPVTIYSLVQIDSFSIAPQREAIRRGNNYVSVNTHVAMESNDQYVRDPIAYINSTGTNLPTVFERHGLQIEPNPTKQDVFDMVLTKDSQLFHLPDIEVENVFSHIKKVLEAEKDTPFGSNIRKPATILPFKEWHYEVPRVNR